MHDLPTQTGPEGARVEARRRPRYTQRRVLAGLPVLLAASTATLLLAQPSGHPGARAAPRSSAASLHARPPAVRRPLTARRVIAARRASPPPGSLPQTHSFPSTHTPLFRSLMAALWAGVVHKSVHLALPAFFPSGAYEQLKAIADARSDWERRLVHDYALDIDAAHSLLGPGAPHASLLRVDAHVGYGHWVPPGVCSNSIGYYELPNARVVYREHRHTRSFGIASMISWRGEWYVVHLGSVLRSSDTGQLDSPSAGTGTSAYSGTC